MQITRIQLYLHLSNHQLVKRSSDVQIQARTFNPSQPIRYGQGVIRSNKIGTKNTDKGQGTIEEVTNLCYPSCPKLINIRYYFILLL